MNKKHLLFIAIGPLAFLIYLHFVVGFNEITDAFTKINFYNYMFYYIAALAATVLSLLFYSMSWLTLMKAASVKVCLKKAFIYCWIGNFVDLIVPLETISGEITKIYLIQRDTGDQPGKIVASIVAHRIITTFMVLCSLSVSSIFFLAKYSVSVLILYLLLAIIFGSLLLIVLLILFSLEKELTKKLIGFSLKLIAFVFKKRLNIQSIEDRIHQNLQQFHSQFKYFSENWRVLAKAAAYSFLAWLLHLSVYFLVFYALGFNEITKKFFEAVVVYSISVSIQSTPIALPLGLMEITMTSLYVLFGVPALISGIATLFIRFATFWFQIIVGYIITQWLGVKNLLTWDRKNTST